MKGEWHSRQQERPAQERALDVGTQHLLYIEDTKRHHPISTLCKDCCKATHVELQRQITESVGIAKKHALTSRDSETYLRPIRACPCTKSL